MRARVRGGPPVTRPAGEKIRTVLSDQERVAWLGLGLAMAGAATLILYFSRGLTFTVDELVWFMQSPDLDLHTALEPHGGHLTLTARVVYKAIFEVFGDSYLPFRLLVVVTRAGHRRPLLRLREAAGRWPGGAGALPGAAGLRLGLAPRPQRQRLHGDRRAGLRDRRPAGAGATGHGRRPARLRPALPRAGHLHGRPRLRRRVAVACCSARTAGGASGSRRCPPPSTRPGGCGR